MINKRTNTTTTGLDWNEMLGLLFQLKRDEKYREYILIAIGSYLGLRIGDILNLRWEDVYNKEELLVKETKTGKNRLLTINIALQEVIKFVVIELSKQFKFKISDYIFINKFGNKISVQYINRILNRTFIEYKIKVNNGSSHALRKTFGKRVWEIDKKSERSLVYLSQIFNHSNIQITRRYIGIVQEDIKNIYLSL